MNKARDLFDNEIAQLLVNSLMLGQKNYIDERIEKQQTMTVSNGYAWTRPNHIDDAIAKADFLDYKLKFAGQAWGYLEFNTQTEQYGNCLLIIKGKQRIKDKFPQIQKSRSGYCTNTLKSIRLT